MTYFKIIILILLILFSCGRNKKYVNTEKTKQQEKIISEYSHLILIDNFDNELILDTFSLGRVAHFSPVYIGEITDTIKLNYKTPKIGHRLAESEQSKYNRPKGADLSIFIDTTKTIGFPMLLYDYYKQAEYRNNKKSYPIFIKNQSSDTLIIGFGDILPMVTEIKDTAGYWHQIEEAFIYDCGTGLTEFYLPPNQIIISTFRQNYGRSKTKFRVRFELNDKAIYSNTIIGSIT